MEVGSEIPKEIIKSRCISGSVRESVRGVLRHTVDSSVVERKWDEAHIRIVDGLEPGKVREELEKHKESWHRLARAMRITATTLDATFMAVCSAAGFRALSFAGMPKDYNASEVTGRNLGTPQDRWKYQLGKQTVYGLFPWIGIAGVTAAVRPAKLALATAGYLTGVAGRPVAHIVDRMVGRPAPVILYGSARANT